LSGAKTVNRPRASKVLRTARRGNAGRAIVRRKPASRGNQAKVRAGVQENGVIVQNRLPATILKIRVSSPANRDSNRAASNRADNNLEVSRAPSSKPRSQVSKVDKASNQARDKVGRAGKGSKTPVTATISQDNEIVDSLPMDATHGCNAAATSVAAARIVPADSTSMTFSAGELIARQISVVGKAAAWVR
jgi:hypothetical protein